MSVGAQAHVIAAHGQDAHLPLSTAVDTESGYFGWIEVVR